MLHLGDTVILTSSGNDSITYNIRSFDQAGNIIISQTPHGTSKQLLYLPNSTYQLLNEPDVLITFILQNISVDSEIQQLMITSLDTGDFERFRSLCFQEGNHQDICSEILDNYLTWLEHTPLRDILCLSKYSDIIRVIIEMYPELSKTPEINRRIMGIIRSHVVYSHLEHHRFGMDIIERIISDIDASV